MNLQTVEWFMVRGAADPGILQFSSRGGGGGGHLQKSSPGPGPGFSPDGAAMGTLIFFV